MPWGHVLLSFLFLIKYVRNPFQMLLNAIVNPKISASGKKAIKKNKDKENKTLGYNH